MRPFVEPEVEGRLPVPVALLTIVVSASVLWAALAWIVSAWL